MSGLLARQAEGRTAQGRGAKGGGSLAVFCAFLSSSLFATEPVAKPSTVELARQVTETEKAFAKTMADRDHAAFTEFLAADAVFFSGDSETLRGKERVAAAWKALYEKPAAPFSWAPEKVEVLDAGNLALSTGPVLDAKGNLVGRFTSIWRLESPGTWRIVFDKGCDVCKACGAQ